MLLICFSHPQIEWLIHLTGSLLTVIHDTFSFLMPPSKRQSPFSLSTDHTNSNDVRFSESRHSSTSRERHPKRQKSLSQHGFLQSLTTHHASNVIKPPSNSGTSTSSRIAPRAFIDLVSESDEEKTKPIRRVGRTNSVVTDPKDHKPARKSAWNRTKPADGLISSSSRTTSITKPFPAPTKAGNINPVNDHALLTGR